jgi:glycosyltransferase involved in cell wall biosynthesis
MEQFRISVAMCTYNGARFLTEQLESLATQTRLPHELVICDDRSTDGSFELIRAFAQRAPFPVRAEMNQANLGTTKNFEKAVSLCQGEIIALADQDDVWKPQKLAVVTSAFDQDREAGYVFSNAELLDERSIPLGRSLWDSGIFRGRRVAEFTRARQVASLLQRSVVTGAAMAFRSDLRNVVLPFSPHFVHDYWISLLLSCVERYGVSISTPLMYYRQHEGQSIGARRKSIFEKINLARSATGEECSERLLGFQDLKDRLGALKTEGLKFSAAHVALIEETLAHWSRRAAAHSARGSGRIAVVFKEVLTGRYGRFSNSWQSIIKDICF